MHKRTIRGQLLKQCRRDMGATQTQLAGFIGVCEKTLRAIERGEASLTTDHLDRLASRLPAPIVQRIALGEEA